METSFIEVAGSALNEPRVQEMIRELSSYGLGVCIPHMHDEQTGKFRQLPTGTVQREDQLQVSFVPRDSVTDHDIPVAWRWNDGLEAVECCRSCWMHGN